MGIRPWRAAGIGWCCTSSWSGAIPSSSTSYGRITDADALGRFAERWYTDPSPNARWLLLAYLERPLNAFRHEALIKRLFKHAEAAGDDAVMARFLVAFDRSVRRVIRKKRHYVTRAGRHLGGGHTSGLPVEASGIRLCTCLESRRAGSRSIPRNGTLVRACPHVPGGTTMPRGTMVNFPVWYDVLNLIKAVEAPDWVKTLKLDPKQFRNATVPPESVLKKLEKFRLFSLRTRYYLRRRAWRYFRKLGKGLTPLPLPPHEGEGDRSDRYIAAISEALVLYEDADVDSGVAFIDNWGLMHALFHHSPVLETRPRGWRLAEDRSLSELEPAPIFEELWRSSPRALYELIVRRGVARSGNGPCGCWVASRPPSARRVSVEELIGLLGHADPEIVAAAIDWLRASPDLASVSPERWLAVAESASPESVETTGRDHGPADRPGPRPARRCRATGRVSPLAAGPARPELAEGQDSRLRRRSAEPPPPARSPGRAAPAGDPGLAAFRAGIFARVRP